MNSISFKNLKFFKSKEPKAPRTKKSAPKEEQKKPDFWKRLIKNPFLYLFVFVAVISYFLAYLPSKSLPSDLIEGEIASLDIVTPEDLTIEDTEATEKRRNEVEEATLLVYDLDPNVYLTAEEEIREFFNSGREWLEKPLSERRSEELQREIREKYDLLLFYNNLRILINTKFSDKIEENLISILGKV
ncbi:MAG: hypothetical protein KAT69_06395, partial [Candidatus Aminicenantes bacterium]|nr:hypothetical protein [Candidatus Aminicenantes bacterium]